MKHTKEPWSYSRTHRLSADAWYVIKDNNGRGPIFEAGGKDKEGQIAEAKHLITNEQEIEANARRIVECVNSCAGMESPKHDIDNMKEVVKWFKEIQQDLQGINPKAVRMLLEACKNAVRHDQPNGSGWWFKCTRAIAEAEKK